MSNDFQCRRCLRTVSEGSLHDGSHKCSDEALAERNESLEETVRDLEERLERVERILKIEPSP